MTQNRRQFAKRGSAILGAASLATIAPRVMLGASIRKRDTLRVAGIGIGGRGKADLKEMSSHQGFRLTAACDVDKSFFKIADQYGDNTKQYQDYRELFKSAGEDFDAVLVATPDHMHSPIAMLAMENNKHVYLQKPLAQDIKECRLLADTAAKKPELATQMGIQIHGSSVYRTAVSWIQSGLIGTVRQVHSWSGKGWGGEMPDQAPTQVPDNLDWDLYLGVAPFHDYVKGYYHRGNWRKWLDFGTGTQGDMGCHIVDPVFSALKIKAPKRVTSLGPKPFEENFPLISKVVYAFKGTEHTTEELELTWYNGSLRPTELTGIPKTIKLPHQGSVFVGDKGSLILPHIDKPQVYNLDGSAMQKLPETVASTNHFHDWIDTALGAKENAGAAFDYSGPLTEAVLMGTVINRWPGMEFNWDASKCEFTGDTEEVKLANALLRPPYRESW